MYNFDKSLDKLDDPWFLSYYVLVLYLHNEHMDREKAQEDFVQHYFQKTVEIPSLHVRIRHLID